MEKQLAYFRHVIAELEARESKTKSISLRRDFRMKQKAKIIKMSTIELVTLCIVI